MGKTEKGEGCREEGFVCGDRLSTVGGSRLEDGLGAAPLCVRGMRSPSELIFSK